MTVLGSAEVQRDLDEVTELLDLLTQWLDVPDQEPPDEEPEAPTAVEFEEVRRALEELRTAVDGVVQNDAAQFQALVAALRQQFPMIIPMITDNVGSAQTQSRDSVYQQLQAVEQLVRDTLEPHQDLPARLEARADETHNLGNRFSHMSKEVRALAEDEAWTGEAAEGYGRVATVQANALVELGGMQVAVANSLRRVAMLNRAAFYFAAEAIRFTAQQLGLEGAHSCDQPFQGSRNVAGQLGALLGKLQGELARIGQGDATQALADEINEVLALPAVLQPTQWPTGGELAGVAPESTANVVRAPSEEGFPTLATP